MSPLRKIKTVKTVKTSATREYLKRKAKKSAKKEIKKMGKPAKKGNKKPEKPAKNKFKYIANVDALISAVQNRPVLWDLRSKDYSNKIKKDDAWKEIVQLLFPEDENADYLELIVKTKWKRLRDKFLKENNEPASKRKRYSRYEQLSFLKLGLEDQLTTSNFEITMKDEEEIIEELAGVTCSTPSGLSGFSSSTDQSNKGNKHEKLDTFEKAILEFLEKENKRKALEEDSDRLFLMSLLPDFRKITGINKYRLKLNIMSLFDAFTPGSEKKNIVFLPPL